jgi:hypothetical protein
MKTASDDCKYTGSYAEFGFMIAVTSIYLIVSYEFYHISLAEVP